VITTTIQRDADPAARPGLIVCARMSCGREASATTLCGATRVPTCPRCTQDYEDRYGTDDTWPLGMMTEWSRASYDGNPLRRGASRNTRMDYP